MGKYGKFLFNLRISISPFPTSDAENVEAMLSAKATVSVEEVSLMTAHPCERLSCQAWFVSLFVWLVTVLWERAVLWG